MIAYDTALLREESEAVYSNPGSPAVAIQKQRQRYAEQLLLLLPALASWVRFSTAVGGLAMGTALLRG